MDVGKAHDFGVNRAWQLVIATTFTILGLPAFSSLRKLWLDGFAGMVTISYHCVGLKHAVATFEMYVQDLVPWENRPSA